MMITKVIMSQRACQYENNNPATGKLTAMKWSVIFESKGLFFQTDELHMMTLPKLEDVQRHVDAHPELTKPTVATSGPKGLGFTFNR